MKSTTAKQPEKIRVLPYIVVTAAVLSLPLIAMQFSNDVKWGLFDFVIIGTLLMGAGLTYEFVSKYLTTEKQKFIAAVLAVLAVLYIWAELAVGIFTNWGS